jgi:hypothetical protein
MPYGDLPLSYQNLRGSRPRRTGLESHFFGQNLSLSQIKDQIALVKGETDPEVEPSMVDRFSQAIKTINQTKRWNDPRKKRKFEKLVLELESFLGD